MSKLKSNTKDLSNVSAALERAKEHGLEAEVILWSLYYAIENPAESVADCLAAGLAEWDV